jgi:hypothetical protein
MQGWVCVGLRRAAGSRVLRRIPIGRGWLEGLGALRLMTIPKLVEGWRLLVPHMRLLVRHGRLLIAHWRRSIGSLVSVIFTATATVVIKRGLLIL